MHRCHWAGGRVGQWNIDMTGEMGGVHICHLAGGREASGTLYIPGKREGCFDVTGQVRPVEH